MSVVHKFLGDISLLPLGELFGELGELDLALRQPRLQLRQVRCDRPAQRLGEGLGVLKPERQELPCVDDGGLRLVLDLRDLLADAARLRRGDLGQLGVVKLPHGVREPLHRRLHTADLLARGLHLRLALALRRVLLELGELRGRRVELLLQREQLLGAHLGGAFCKLLGVDELLHDEGPRVRDGLLRVPGGRFANRYGLARLGGREGLDSLQEGKLTLGRLLDLGLRLLDPLDGLGDELRGLQSLLLIRGRLDDVVELLLRIRDAGPHARELLLQEALGALELHVHKLGRSTELSVGRGRRLVHALHGLGGGLVLCQWHGDAGHLLDFGLGRLQSDGNFAEHLLHADAFLHILCHCPQLGDLRLHVVHPRLKLPELGAGAGAGESKLLQIGSLLEEVLPCDDDACLRCPLCEVRVLHRFCKALRDSLSCSANVAQRLRGLTQPLHLRLCSRHLGLDLLQEVPALPVGGAGPELRQALSALLKTFLQHVDLFLDGLCRALGVARHFDKLLGNESLSLRKSCVNLRGNLVSLCNQVVHVIPQLLAAEERKLCFSHLLQLVLRIADLLRDLPKQCVGSNANLCLLHRLTHLVQLLLRLLATLLQCLELVSQRAGSLLGDPQLRFDEPRALGER
mmetsp:Transcript_20759/g.64833  ORF Transcript_20759/g.64833 Transcript_20759/m.64833 type:complete len:630 (+) Transcript_20759:2953-4842(+)